MFDLKVIHSVLTELETERGIPKEKIIEAIEMALATAYKKEYGRRGQFIRCSFDLNSGKTEFAQVKVVVDESQIIIDKDAYDSYIDELRATTQEGDELKTEKIFYNEEQHIMIEDAQKIKKDVKVGEELIFPLEQKEDYGRIAAQTAKQVIIQKIREAEKVSVLAEYGQKEGEIVSGTVQRVERGNVFIDMGRAVGFLPYEEQIPGEHYRQGERLRCYLVRVEETPRGVFVRLSRSHPKFLAELFKSEVPEIASGVVEIKSVAREAGARSKVAVFSSDSHIDPVGSMVGQRGVRVSTVTSELGGEKIDIVEWSEDTNKFIEEALSPARIISIKLDEVSKTATVEVTEDQQSLAIGKGGQNVRLAAKLTGWRIDIQSVAGETPAEGEEGSEKSGKEKSTKKTKKADIEVPAEAAIPSDETTDMK